MFKKIALLTAALIVGIPAFAKNNTNVLMKWDASNKFKSNTSIYCAKGNKATKKYSVDPENPNSGSLLVKIEKSNLKALHMIQLTFIFPGEITKGTKYKIKMSLESDQTGQIAVCAIMLAKPWSAVGKKTYLKENLLPNKSKDITIEFMATDNFKKVRVPCLYLGKLKAGTQLNIKSVSFEQVSP